MRLLPVAQPQQRIADTVTRAPPPSSRTVQYIRRVESSREPLGKWTDPQSERRASGCPGEAGDLKHSRRHHQRARAVPPGRSVQYPRHSHVLVARPPTIPQLLTKHTTTCDLSQLLPLGPPPLPSVSSQPHPGKLYSLSRGHGGEDCGV